MTNQTAPVTKETIEGYIKRHSSDATSEKAAAVLNTAQRARALGFTSVSNVRLAQFWEDIVPPKDLQGFYAEHYPNCQFLTWRGLHRVIETLKLKFDRPEFYAGAIPDNQLMMLEMFERRQGDSPRAFDFVDLVFESPGHTEEARNFALYLAACEMNDNDALHSVDRGGEAFRYLPTWNAAPSSRAARAVDSPILRVKAYIREFSRDLFVVAPPGAFTTGDNDWIARARSGVAALSAPVPAPPDPLVVSPVRSGVLVVAAWGDEAEAINGLANDLGV